MIDKLKKYETIGACGIDCGLCPRFYTKGNSICPGCGGLNFKEKHPPCGTLTCCLRRGFETCGECADFPCSRYKSESENLDSFVTHKRMISNLEYIKKNGIEQFIAKQKVRIDILTDFLTNYDGGKARTFFCQTCALLPIDKLREIQSKAKNTIANTELKAKINLIRVKITEIAGLINIDLKLNKKTKK